MPLRSDYLREMWKPRKMWPRPYDPSGAPMPIKPRPEMPHPLPMSNVPMYGGLTPPIEAPAPEMDFPERETTISPPVSPEMLAPAREVMGGEYPDAIAEDATEKRIQEMQAEAEELREMERETEHLEKRAKLLKAQNALAKAKEEQIKQPRETREGGYEGYKRRLLEPSPEEALSWEKGDFVTGRPASQGLQDYITAGGTIEDLMPLRQQAAEEMLEEPQYPEKIWEKTRPRSEAEIAESRAVTEGLRRGHAGRRAAMEAEFAQRRAKKEVRRRAKHLETPTGRREAHELELARIEHPPKQFTRDNPQFYLNQGYTPEEAELILNKRFGLPTSNDPVALQKELERWQNILRKTYELGMMGAMGELMDEETNDLAKEKIAEIRQKLGGLSSPQAAGKYKVGDVVEQGGTKFRITGFDPDGTPTGEPI